MSAVEFRRKVEWGAAYDKRDPNPSKNYGIHGMEVRFLLESQARADRREWRKHQ